MNGTFNWNFSNLIIDPCRVINAEFLAAPICDFMLEGHHFQLQNEFALEFVKASKGGVGNGEIKGKIGCCAKPT